MSIWQDSTGALHDDMDGAALALPTWPQGMTELTAAQVAALPKPPAPPLVATPYQIRKALTMANLRAQVESAVAASTDQDVKDAWAYAQQFVETDPFITAMAAQLSQTPAQVHALFVAAQALAP